MPESTFIRLNLFIGILVALIYSAYGEKETCPDPGVSYDGTKIGHCCVKGDVFKYTCKETFELVGKESISCLPDGKWSAPRPRCRPPGGFCPDPPNILNGAIVGNNKRDYYLPKDEAEVVCNPGFIYDEEIADILCKKTFEWEKEFGECRESFCKLPEFRENGSIPELESTNFTVFPYKFEISHVCNPGYRLIGQSIRFCNTGQWSGKAPYCEAIKCPDPGVPVYGMRDGDNFNIGEKVVFRCFTGFNLIGSVEKYCLRNGQWSGELTRCNDNNNFCPDPGVPINGMKMGNRYEEGEKVEFRCHPGFFLIGSEMRECLSNKTWSGIEAKCSGAYDFDDVQDVSQVLKRVISEMAKQQENELAIFNKPRGRGRKIDIHYRRRLVLYFIFDVSSCISRGDFDSIINFAKTLVKKIRISERGARAGALTFNSTSKIQFLPIKFNTTDSVMNALDNIVYTGGGGAKITSALRMVRQEMIPLTTQKFGWRRVKTIVFILTKGKANTGGDPEDDAKLLKDDGVEIYCIGVTNRAHESGLCKIASQPLNDHVFILSNYKVLNWLIQEITIDYTKCGITVDKKQQPRIAGEENAVEAWPWMTAIYLKHGYTPLKPKLYCGGSIIGKQWILTAAHCLFEKQEADTIIKLGLTDLQIHNNVQEFEVDTFFIHPKYNHSNYDYDVALIKLNRLIQFNPYVRPVCLPPMKLPADTELYKPHQNAFVIGWGYSQRRGESVSFLREFRLPLQLKETCENSLENKFTNEDKKLLTNRMFCAGTGQGDGGSCRGDSGGPLMQSQLKNGDVYWTLIGVMSWGIGCEVPNTYEFYTHVHSLLQWILFTMDAE